MEGKTRPSPAPQPATGVVILNPVRSVQRDQKPPGTELPKLGRLHRARQGLVRVPESNTKYGGKGEKTGVVCVAAGGNYQ